MQLSRHPQKPTTIRSYICIAYRFESFKSIRSQGRHLIHLNMNYAAVDEVPTWNRSTTGILWYGNVFPQGRAFGAREKSTCEAYACNNRCEKHFLGKRFHHGNKELRWGLVSISPVWFFSASLVSVWFCLIVHSASCHEVATAILSWVGY